MDEEYVFLKAIEIDSDDQRAEFLGNACGQDAEMRKGIETLIRHHDVVGSFLEQPPTEFVATIANSELDTLDQSDDLLSLGFLQPSDKSGCLGMLGPYEVRALVGRGGMGLVLKAYDPKLNRVVAIKLMTPQLAGNASAVKRFLREARATAAIIHDCVVTIHAIDDSHRPPLIVMEFIEGQSLQDKVKLEGALELDEILKIGMQTAAGLAAAHRQGLIHRDIKPSNILIEHDSDRVRLTDFGLARSVDDIEITGTGQIVGTPQYMSPEQARGQRIDHRTDLFSLGSVLYRMCTGRPAFWAENSVALLRCVCDDEPQPIREINPEIPQWLESIVMKLMQKNAAYRFESAQEVSDLLGQHLANRQGPTVVTVPKAIDVPCAEPGAGELSTTNPSPEKVRRWPLIATGSVVFAACLFAASVFYLQTNFGLVRVNVTDESIEATISGQTVLMKDGEQSLSVRSGDHHLLVRRGDFEFETDAFELRRDGEVVIKVEMLADEIVVAKDGARFASKRLQAEMPSDKSADSIWVPLFNGKDLAGWKTNAVQSEGWSVENGILVGRSTGRSHLFSERDDFQDFHLRAEIKINTGVDSGIFFRSPFEIVNGVPIGLEAQIKGIPEEEESGRQMTGSLFKILPPPRKGFVTLQNFSRRLTAPNQWFELEIIAQGKRIRIKINGQQTANYLESDTTQMRGHIVLQVLGVYQATSQPTVVQFRKIEVAAPQAEVTH